MKRINKDTIKKISDLIKIKINKDEIGKYEDQLNNVLSAVEVLQEVNTDEIQPTTQTHGLANILRDDEVMGGLDMEKYKNTKNFRNGYFVIKKVI